MGNFFDEVGNCQTCYDEGVIIENDFVGDFCPDCEKGQEVAEDYAKWYAEYEMDEYTKERELI
jgi:hypothetical protein